MTRTAPPDYCGHILSGPYSSRLQARVRRCIAGFRAFDRTDVPVISYISAWQMDDKLIWYEFVSQRFLRLLQCRPNEIATAFREAILDHRLYKYIDSSDAIKENVLGPEQLGSSRKRLRNQRSRVGFVDAVYKLRLPNNREIWLKDWGSIETFEGDKVCLSLGYLTDVTKEMMQKDQFSEQNIVVSRDKNLLVEAERHNALGQISAQVFHAIRNPLAAIGGLAKRILTKGGATNLHLYAEVIAKEAARLERLLNALFQFTQTEEPHKQAVDPGRLVKNALALLKTELDKNSIKIHFEAPNRLPELIVDVRQIEEALVHIIKNAIEALSEQGKIDIKLQEDGQYLFFIVKDYGLGIRPIHEQRVTEPFFTTKVYGSGFGLSLAKKYIELHQGTLRIVSGSSSGTKVVVKLPCGHGEGQNEKN
ncbi:MAG: HAMP domain-containing sensor histidine kinase [Thermodesulfobacteriota bacterium]